MAFSKEVAEYYLTDEGWVQVYVTTDTSPRKQLAEIPEKYYLICEYREVQTSPFSQMQSSVIQKYEDPASSARISALVDRFGGCPEGI